MNLNNAAKWVADLMKADGVKQEQVTPELAIAYFEEMQRRIVKIQNTYLTRDGARSAMCAAVFSAVRA